MSLIWTIGCTIGAGLVVAILGFRAVVFLGVVAVLGFYVWGDKPTSQPAPQRKAGQPESARTWVDASRSLSAYDVVHRDVHALLTARIKAQAR